MLASNKTNIIISNDNIFSYFEESFMINAAITTINDNLKDAE